MDSDRILARARAIALAITFSESALLRNVQVIQSAAEEACAAGSAEAGITLPVEAWLALVDELKDRRPRNYSRLIRDDFIERLEEHADSLGKSISLMGMILGDGRK